MMRFKNSGFTLLELLIVVIIVGVLATVAIPRFLITADRARETNPQRMLADLMTAEMAYYQDNGVFTATLGDLLVTVPPMQGWNAPTPALNTNATLSDPDVQFTVTSNHGHTTAAAHQVVGAINSTGEKDFTITRP